MFPSVVPESHRWPENFRPKVAHDEYVPGLELPVIDLQEEDHICVPKVAKACNEWGFFQLVNHGVPISLLDSMQLMVKSFFTRSSQEKIKITEEGTKYHKLYDGISRKKYVACSWVEGLNIHDFTTIPRIASKAWPDEADEKCATFSNYLDEMHKLGNKLLRLLILSLGIDSEAISGETMEKSGFTGTRFNYYPSCPDPSKALGVPPHSDPNFVTILHQDDIGGLQIAKDGKWIGVKPIQNALVINIGDSFQAWSNCRYKSVEHRAVVNTNKPRISIAYFYGPVEDIPVQPPKELIDEEHPSTYKPFLYKNYLDFRRVTHLFGKNAFESYAALGSK